MDRVVYPVMAIILDSGVIYSVLLISVIILLFKRSHAILIITEVVSLNRSNDSLSDIPSRSSRSYRSYALFSC